MIPELAAVSQGQRAQRIEVLLLHEFHAKKFLLPDKMSQRVGPEAMHPPSSISKVSTDKNLLLAPLDLHFSMAQPCS